MNGVRCRLVVAVLAVLALAGCSSRTIPGTGVAGTNGLERKTPEEVVRDAAAALRGAKSVRVRIAAGGENVEAEFRIRGSSGSGWFTRRGDRGEVVQIGETLYLRGHPRALTGIGLPAQVAELGPVTWLKLSRQQPVALPGRTMDQLVAQLTGSSSTPRPQVEQGMLAGRKAVVVGWQDGSQLYVANLGPAYPLRGTRTGDDRARLDFSEYGSDVQITAPEDAVEVDRLALGPDLVKEFRWLNAITAMRVALDHAFDPPRSGLYESDVAKLADTLHRCGRELVQPGPPSERMRPAYDVVIRACQEYDRGADCLAHALTVWDLPQAPGAGAMHRALECGYGVKSSAGTLLDDAHATGLTILAPS
jgi:hypothetical protein